MDFTSQEYLREAAGSTSPGLIGFLTLGPCFSPPPVLKPFTPTSDISAECQFRPPGLVRFCPRSRLTIGQGAFLLSNPQAIENPSFCFIPLGPAADDRGWIALLIGALVMFVIFTWRKGACRTLGLKGLI
jgi:hypothetical protein